MITVTATLRRLVAMDVRLPVTRNISTEVPLVQGDTGPKLRFDLKDQSGQAIGVSGAGTVRLFLQRYNEKGVTNAGHEDCEAYDAPNGQWVYSLQPGDVSGAGTYFGDVEVTYDDGTRETAYEAVRFLVRERGTP